MVFAPVLYQTAKFVLMQAYALLAPPTTLYWITEVVGFVMALCPIARRAYRPQSANNVLSNITCSQTTLANFAMLLYQIAKFVLPQLPVHTVCQILLSKQKELVYYVI